jgi:uncharacterized protein (TIGR03435 family)
VALAVRVLALFSIAGFLGAQTPTFEVASVKPAAPFDRNTNSGPSGGPGTKDPGRWSARFMPLSALIGIAYDIRPFQLSGPKWLENERFDLVATVPAGATRDDLRPMLRNLLEERFGLKAHRERKEVQVYELVVTKGGPKLAETPPPKPADPEEPPKLDRSRLSRDRYGFPIVPPGIAAMASTSNGRFRLHAVGETMDQFGGMLSTQVDRPVLDRTGLKGKYDFTLTWTTESAAAASPAEDVLPNLTTALQEQLGLKLESKAGMVEFLVIDQIAKTPTEN